MAKRRPKKCKQHKRKNPSNSQPADLGGLPEATEGWAPEASSEWYFARLKRSIIAALVYNTTGALSIALVVLSALLLILSVSALPAIDIGTIMLVIHACINSISIAHIEALVAGIQFWLAIKETHRAKKPISELSDCRASRHKKNRKSK